MKDYISTVFHWNVVLSHNLFAPYLYLLNNYYEAQLCNLLCGEEGTS